MMIIFKILAFRFQISDCLSAATLGTLVFAAVIFSSSAVFSDTAPIAAASTDSSHIAVSPPPFTPGIYPCSRCHSKLLTNPTRRKMRWAHEEIELKHDEENRWCLDCHSALDRDKLHLASGKFVEFTESYKLCGQCHGTKLRDWKAGAHGKRTGSWNGQKRYLLCANCHNPHSPHFKPLAPMPPPKAPGGTHNPSAPAPGVPGESGARR